MEGATQIMLYPFNNEFQTIISQEIIISGDPKISNYQDFYNNTVGSFMLVAPHDFLSIESNLEVITYPVTFPEDSNTPSKQWGILEELTTDIKFLDYFKIIHFDGTAEIKTLIKKFNKQEISPYKLALKLCDYIYLNFKYIQGVTNVDSKLDDVWRIKAGVCQDFSYMLLQMMRMCGIPARYVSGYICPNDSNTRGEGATHAWIEVYIPFYGWLGLDPTNNVIASEYHVKIAIGKNYKDCTPVKGVFKGDATDSLYVQVSVSTIKPHCDINFEEDTLKHEVLIDKPNKNRYRMHLELMQKQQQQ